MSETEETQYLTVYSSKSLSKQDEFSAENNSSSIDKTLIKTIKLFSELLTEICEQSKNNTSKSIYIKSFMTKNIPSISLKNYIKRLFLNAKMNESTIILILIYIDKICSMNNITISYYNIYKLILGSMIIAIKYNEDKFYPPELYAKLGGVAVCELNLLEIEFFKLIDFQLFVKEEIFLKYKEYLMNFEDEEEDEE